MNQYDNTNKGIIGKNDRKEKDSHPDITGSINVEGTEYWLSGWQKQRKDGSGSFYSLAVKPKDQPNEYANQSQGGTPSTEGIDDEIPF